MRTARFIFAAACAIATLGALVVSAPAPARTVDAVSAFEGFDEWVESVREEWKVPGLAVGVVLDGEVVLAKGYGYRDVEKKLPVTKDTLFAIGSNSKSFTAMVMGMLSDDGKLDWDQPVRDVMPDFRLHDPVATAQMTPRDLVTHRSGLPRHDLLWYASGLSREELYHRLRHLEPSRPFREAFQYQNLMFMTAGYLVERVTGKTWEEVVDERILDPLNMERTNFSVDQSVTDPDFAYPYLEIDDEIVRIPFRNIDAVGPAGSINSSVEEMMRYVQLHLDYGKVGDEELLSEATARRMQRPQMVVGGPITAADSGHEVGPTSYGLGLMIGTYRGHHHVRHGGGIDGFVSAMEWLPHEDMGVVVLTNTSSSGAASTLIVRNVFDRLLGLDPIDWGARVREQIDKGEAEQEEARQKDLASRREDTSPSHELGEYVGSYEHPGYGVAEVRQAESGLTLNVVGFDLPLDHYHYDIFFVPYDLPPPVGRFGGSKVTFLYNKKGDIDRLHVPLESSVDDIVFTRQEDESP